MRFAWIGSHREGLPAFEALLHARAPIVAAVSLTADAAAKRSAAADYAPICHRTGVPLHRVSDINSPDSVALLRSLDLDVLFVIGWSQILRKDALATARIGVVGAHASLLPANRGSAPINWALIHGERETGNSLLWLAESVDAGAVIDQMSFGITPYDTCTSLYDRVAITNRDMLVRLSGRLLAGERPGVPQPVSTDPVLPRRRPADGLLDWAGPSTRVYDFVRALTRPYPGAFGQLDGHRIKVWQAALPPLGEATVAEPGTCLGPVVSPEDNACGQLVACGQGAVVLLEVEGEDGRVLRGRALSEEPWRGRTWTRE
ncbi:MAG TPA: methionyl-tRNA formyltransferase [Gemmatimonadales bacterium]|jgi:methionyl-tRNA formyltransferase|nr:methionyl-tRNA formyltransferase [Gemmatimonadales bacterium]